MTKKKESSMDLNDLGHTVEQTVEKNLSELGDRVRPQIEEAKRRLQALNNQASSVIKEHPALCLLGAVGLGYLIARLARRSS
jgi:hypothetical protein